MASMFYIDIEDENPHHKVLFEDSNFSWLSLGAGDDRFNTLLKDEVKQNPKNLSLAPLKCLRKIIHDPQYPTVAGTIQFGDFKKDNNFHLSGVSDWCQKTNMPKFFIRGTDVESINNKNDLDGFYVSYQYILPFSEEIKEEIYNKRRG